MAKFFQDGASNSLPSLLLSQNIFLRWEDRHGILLRALLLLSSWYLFHSICTTVGGVGVGSVNFLYICDTSEHAKNKPLKSYIGMACRKFTLHIYLWSAEKSQCFILTFFFPVATVGKDWPNKLQPGPAMYIPLTRCAQLDACSNSVKGQPKLILPVKPGSSGGM